MGQDTTRGNTVTVVKTYAGAIAEPFMGKLSFQFKRQDSSAMPELDCDVTSVISNYFVPAADSATQNNNTTVGNYSGKKQSAGTGQQVSLILKPLEVMCIISFTQNLPIRTERTKQKALQGFTSFGSASAETKNYIRVHRRKRNPQYGFFRFSVSTAGGLNQPNLSQNTISVPGNHY